MRHNVTRPTRRQVIRTAAATLCLPLLPSALPRETWATAPAPVRRLLFWFLPNGLLEEEVTPAEVGPLAALPAVMASLEAHRARMSIFSGLWNYGAGMGGIHEWLAPSLLSDHFVKNTVSGPLDGGLTVDEFIAQRLTDVTPFRALVLGTGEAHGNAIGNIGVYYTNLSWSAMDTPVAPIVDPKILFDRMFGGELDGATEARVAARQSVLDAVAERAASIQKTLDAADKQKLDQFETAVRELELRIELIRDVACEPPEAPVPNLPFVDRVELMSDLMVLALQCDYTRVCTFGIGPTTTSTAYTHIGIDKGHHKISHDYGFSGVDYEWLLQIHDWNFAQWGKFLAKLQAVPTPTGDLLSETLCPLITETGVPTGHRPNLPMMMAGGEAGGIVQGNHLWFGEDYAHSNVLRAFAEYMQVDASDFGENATETANLLG
jgi:Protein of unknown function (DUF1552)